jgi:hypothetical protein
MDKTYKEVCEEIRTEQQSSRRAMVMGNVDGMKQANMGIRGVAPAYSIGEQINAENVKREAESKRVYDAKVASGEIKLDLEGRQIVAPKEPLKYRDQKWVDPFKSLGSRSVG